MNNIILLVIRSKTREESHGVQMGQVQVNDLSQGYFLIELTGSSKLNKKGKKVVLFGLFVYLYPNVNE